MIPETVEALSVACQRAFFVTLAASVSVALIIAVQTFKLSEEQHLIEKKQVSLESIHGVARIVASDLNFRLLQDYAEAQDDADAIHSLLSDVLSSRTALLSLRDAIAEDRNMETERRVDLNTKLNKLLVLSFFNQGDESLAPTIDGEATLILADTSVGSFSRDTAVEQRTLQDLARLSYLASIRPKRIKETLLASISSFDTLRQNEVNHSLKQLSEIASRASEVSARSNAETLWKKWLTSDPANPVDEQLFAGLTLEGILEEYLRVLRSREDTADWGSDEVNANLIGLSQPLELRFLVLVIPFFVCGGFAFCWYAMTNIRNSCALISADVKWIPSANVFLDNRFQTYWYLRGFVIAMPWFLQITILVILPPGLTKLGLQDLFWAFWIGVALSFLFMLGTAVSARRATEALSQKWRELQGARSQR